MKIFKSLVLFLILLLGISSCKTKIQIVKRVHKKGYYIATSSTKKDESFTRKKTQDIIRRKRANQVVVQNDTSVFLEKKTVKSSKNLSKYIVRGLLKKANKTKEKKAEALFKRKKQSSLPLISKNSLNDDDEFVPVNDWDYWAFYLIYAGFAFLLLGLMVFFIPAEFSVSLGLMVPALLFTFVGWILAKSSDNSFLMIWSYVQGIISFIIGTISFLLYRSQSS